MIFAGELGTKRIIELHKTKSNEILVQVEKDKAELEKLVGKSYLNKLTAIKAVNNKVVLGCYPIALTVVLNVKGYVEEMVNPITGTITLNGSGKLYFTYEKGYLDMPMKLEYTASDGTVYVKNITAGIVDVYTAINDQNYALKLDRVIDHIRFVSEQIALYITAGDYFYVFK